MNPKSILGIMQKNNVKISVIMPVYNVEDYLKKAIDSILNQSLTDFELFLVDDGSIDNSGKICDEYANNDNRIKVLHQKNSGAHIARNNALKRAIGEYVCFFDSDDYIDVNMLSDLYTLAKNNDSDAVVSGFYINTYINNDQYIVLDYIPYTRNNVTIDNYHDKSEFRINAYKNFDKNMFYPPWNKLFKLSYLIEKNITFPITYRDDFPFVLDVIKDIQNIIITKKQYYHFIRKRSDSETQKFVKNLYEKREEEHLKMIELYKYWGLDNDKNSMEMISRRYIDRIIECMVNLFNKECDSNKVEKKQLITQYINTNNFNYCIKNAVPQKFYLKIMYLILKTKNISLCYIMAQFINYIKTKNIKMFSILKTNR